MPTLRVQTQWMEEEGDEEMEEGPGEEEREYDNEGELMQVEPRSDETVDNMEMLRQGGWARLWMGRLEVRMHFGSMNPSYRYTVDEAFLQ